MREKIDFTILILQQNKQRRYSSALFVNSGFLPKSASDGSYCTFAEVILILVTSQPDEHELHAFVL